MTLLQIQKEVRKEINYWTTVTDKSLVFAEKKTILAFLDSKIEEAYRAGKDKEVCICAAVKFKNGMIVRGQRHGDCFYTARRIGIASLEKEQGFITSKNRFVGRQEGRKLQEAAGIKSASPEGYVADTLFSEDLY